MKNKEIYTSIEGFEELDVRFYVHLTTKENGKLYHYWSLDTTAKEIELKGFEEFTFFISKIVENKKIIWKISEALTGMSVYSSKEDELKGKAIENALLKFKKKKINSEKLKSLVLKNLNTYGLSKKYRA